VGGSIDLVAAARVVIIVAPDPDDQAPNPNNRRRIACVAKSNVGASPDPVAFTLWEGRFGWDPTPVLGGLTAEALLETPPAGTEERGALEEAVGFLREALAEGPRTAKEIRREAREAGIADRTLARAKAILGVKSRKTTGGGPWTWELDGPRAMHDQGCQGCQECQHGILGADRGSPPPDQGCQEPQGGTLGNLGILAPSEPDQGCQECQPGTLAEGSLPPDQGCQLGNLGILAPEGDGGAPLELSLIHI